MKQKQTGAAALFGPRRNAAWASALRSPLWGCPQASLRFAQPPSDCIRIDRLTCGRQIPLQGFTVRSTRSGGEFSAKPKTVSKKVRSTEDKDSPERATAVRSLRREAGQAATVSGEKDRRRRAFWTSKQEPHEMRPCLKRQSSKAQGFTAAAVLEEIHRAG